MRLCLLYIVTISVFAPVLLAQKEPYTLIYFDVGGDMFKHQSSSASSQTSSNCNSVQAAVAGLSCPEQFSTVGAGSFAMGVRPIRYLQIDGLGVDILGNYNGFNSRTSTFQCVKGCSSPTITTESISGTSALATTGGRFVFPLFQERLLLSAGVGFGWLWTNEKVQTTAQTMCESCRHVGGHGATEVAEIMYLPKPHVGIGIHVRNVQINSSGLTLDANDSNIVFGTKYKDRFLLIGGEISIRFGTRH